MTRLVINPDRVLGVVSPLVFGSFIENLESCIYGGVYDPASPQADATGCRRDVIAAAKAMGVSIVRFPGGCFAPYYHWRDGVGPQTQRPLTRYGGMVLGRTEDKWPASNAFGTDEFVAWCRQLGAEPFLCVNMGTGTAEEARDWVEYCNGEAGSRWADLRIAHGCRQPHNVKWWALGNEISGPWELGYAPDPHDYVRRARDYARAMRNADPTIKLVLAGSHFPLDHKHRDWNRIVLEELHGFADAITFHHYAGLMGRSNVSGSEGPPVWSEIGTEAVHRQICFAMRDAETAIGVMREDIRLANFRAKKHKPIAVALTEYGIWYRTWLKRHDERYNLADALTLAAYFNIFIRNADILQVANHAQLVQVLPPILVESGGARSVRQTISHVFEMFLPNRAGTAVDCWHDGPVWFEQNGETVPVLDASASKVAGKVVLNLVNRHPTDPLPVTLDLLHAKATGMTGRLLTGKLDDTNTFEEPGKIVPQPVKLKQVVVPPASLMIIELAATPCIT